MSGLDAKSILERLKERMPKLERIETKSLGVVFMRRQTGEDQVKIKGIQDGLTQENLKALPKSMFAALFGAVMLRNEDGTPVFEDPLEGYKLLCQVGAEELIQLFDEMARISGTDEHAVENAEKKSLGGQISDSGSN
jgi:hypothetical protein